jgi:hypothetical protein
MTKYQERHEKYEKVGEHDSSKLQQSFNKDPDEVKGLVKWIKISISEFSKMMMRISNEIKEDMQK